MIYSINTESSKHWFFLISIIWEPKHNFFLSFFKRSWGMNNIQKRTIWIFRSEISTNRTLLCFLWFCRTIYLTNHFNSIRSRNYCLSNKTRHHIMQGLLKDLCTFSSPKLTDYLVVLEKLLTSSPYWFPLINNCETSICISRKNFTKQTPLYTVRLNQNKRTLKISIHWMIFLFSRNTILFPKRKSS